MKNLLLLVVGLFLVFSCNEEVDPIDESFLVEEIFNDLAKLQNEVMLSDSETIIKQFKWYEEQINKGVDVDTKDFYVGKLGISMETYRLFQNYPKEKLDIMRYEIDNPESDGLMYQYYINSKKTNLKTCGDVGTVFMIMNSGFCLAGYLPSCIGAAYGWYDFISSGCAS